MQVAREELRGERGIIYTYPCGHEYHQTAKELHEYIANGGPDRPDTCPTCVVSDSDLQVD